MSETKRHIKWEQIGLAGLAGLIVVGFLVTVVAMIRSGRTATIVVASEEEAVEIILPQATNRVVTPRVIRQYNRPLAVHSLDAWSSAAVAQPEAAAANREEGVKDLRDRDDAPAKAFAVDVIADMRAPTQPPRQGQPRGRKGFLDDDANEKDSGWGWLADSISSGGGKSKTDGEEGKSGDDDKEQADGESGEQRNAAATASSSSEDGKPVYFMDAAYERSAKTDDKQRAATSASVKEARGDDAAAPANREEAVAAGEEDGSAGNAFAAMLERDPFSSASYDQESASRWGADANADDRSRAADSETAAAGAAGAGMFLAGTDAASGGGSGWWSGNASASPTYGSDAYFNSGGGYSPATLGAVDAGGYGVAGGAVVEAGAFSPAALSSGAGAAPLSGGSAFSMPAAGGSTFGTGRTQEEPVRPVTLPW